ncbi:hypothetical protein [Pseudoalteromonas luteoviolacea]|uniref:Uncharacterized protein n=1 Tax=Pseudoalteromonas luteoviolacea H33 TaxID=1365251 RepID=A0A162A8G5_9GAMM|nr:hypothetical protein [Pseudoalteromonas luteoviolacea]KZN45813.1 hypothetical protein N476_24935 [Pseudoalteromonas luteoviolacea H33]KZN76932.1 hypothetical protein N477_13815 [Pseudoalteromonas luteoviolacea H33-S]MBQ4880231.1 hypothetical protein [Pseudoalteromonas luteoviolacea]MBQ4909292.1 hypothetical protein [Pseudoalteromonas luteoviolacea]
MDGSGVLFVLFTTSNSVDPTEDGSAMRNMYKAVIHDTQGYVGERIGSASFKINRNYSSGILDNLTVRAYISTYAEGLGLLKRSGGQIYTNDNRYDVSRVTRITSDYMPLYNFLKNVHNKTARSAQDFSFFW